MAELTAAEVQALAALAENNPMTIDELARAVADAGMHLASEINSVLRNLVDMGLAEQTPAASLGKYRITVDGRVMLASAGQGD
jgi:predicted transcriptional regulator